MTTSEHMRGLVLVFATALAAGVAQPPRPSAAAARTQVVLLGTGSPPADPLRSGPATAIVVNDSSYLVDLGPGLVRRAAAAADKGIPSLAAHRLQTAFVTHLHSDHTVGYPDLIFTTWVQGRRSALKVYGPAGLEEMTRHILLAWQADIAIRTSGLEHRSRAGLDVEAHDITPGVVYQDANVKVTAFRNAHGEWTDTFGYRFDTADRSIVVSGDTSPSEELIKHCQKCDVLIHEAYANSYRPADMANWLEYRSKYHTTTSQLSEIAARTHPALLIVYHRGVGRGANEIPESQYVTEIRRGYDGKVVVGHDLDVY
jgi:ribonuclease BN (tRNA processing enzyme)